MENMPRLKKDYNDRIISALKEEFGYNNVMQVPKLEKIVISKGVGAAIADKKLIEYASTFDQFVWPNTIHVAKTLICRLSSFICIKNVVLVINVAMPDRIVNMTDSSNLCPNFDILLSSLKYKCYMYYVFI